VTLFLKALAFGFLLAASVGPLWVLCFRRTLSQGPLAGLASGMGVALADGLYGAVAAFGLTAISGFLLRHAFWIGLAGGAFLVYLGAKTLLARPSLAGGPEERIGYAQAFLSTLGLTLANPPTLVAFAAIFAGLGLVTSDYGAAAWVVLGVFLGSGSWWVVLVAGTSWLRGRIGPRLLRSLNVVAGLSILAFAAWQFAVLLR
jgi:threonine/homoserine/homoserine lactone efflux protein